MTDQAEIGEGPSSAADSAPVLATSEDLAAIDLIAALNGLDRADDYALERALDRAAKEAEAAGNTNAQRGYQLLSILCTLHLRVEDPALAWAPRWEGPDGRSYTASDFRGEQNTILAAIIDVIPHPALPARIADVVWYNDRKQNAAATAAVDAYCVAIARRLDGTYAARFEDRPDSIFDLVDWLNRSLQIIALSRKRGELPDTINEAFEALYQ